MLQKGRLQIVVSRANMKGPNWNREVYLAKSASLKFFQRVEAFYGGSFLLSCGFGYLLSDLAFVQAKQSITADLNRLYGTCLGTSC